MQVKKFIAPTLKEATLNMKDALGSEAVILGTRIVESDGGFGLRRMFEITAGMEDEKFEEEAEGLEVIQNEKSVPNFSRELKEISMRFNNQAAPRNVTPREKIKIPEQKIETMDGHLRDLVETLSHKDVQKDVIASVVAELTKYKKFLHSSNIDNYVLSALSSMIPTSNIELKKSGHPRIISFVGPTGVGKTTCIAKLAVIAKILHNLDVGLISIDTYRLGAIDQLKIFSEITKTDLLVAYDPDEVEKHLHTFRKKDIIFVDTAGRSPKNTDQLKKTKEFLDVLKSNETFLVLSTTSTTRSMADAADKFSLFNYSSFIFTKIDEAVTFGNIINLTSDYKKPVAYLSNGQTIPDDIISADPEFIANIIYTGNYLNVRPS
ncbi:MAG: flagellar biosynthesis protein FlhF [Ignavibacteriaceae bacterium]